MFDSLDISASALQAQRTRLDTIATNIANMNTTQGLDGNPYRRRYAVFAQGQEGDSSRPGVHVSKIEKDQGAFRVVDRDGKKVLYPNIDLSQEFVDALECSRAYEANVTTMEVTKAMINASLRLVA